jgi:hypothetical protein
VVFQITLTVGDVQFVVKPDLSGLAAGLSKAQALVESFASDAESEGQVTLSADTSDFKAGMDSAKNSAASATAGIKSSAEGTSTSVLASFKNMAAGAIGSVSEMVSGIVSKVVSMASTVLGIIAPIGGAFTTAFAIKAAADFQEELYDLERTSHLTGAALKEVTDYSRDLSTDLGQSRESLDKTATTLASIGKTPEGINKLTKSVAELAEVSGGSNVEIAAIEFQSLFSWNSLSNSRLPAGRPRLPEP